MIPLNIKYCKKCGRAYDIGTNFELCPDCKYNETKKREGDANKK